MERRTTFCKEKIQAKKYIAQRGQDIYTDNNKHKSTLKRENNIKERRQQRRIQPTSIIIPRLRKPRKASNETNKDKRKTNTCNIETTPLTTSGIKKTNQKYPSNHKCTYD